MKDKLNKLDYNYLIVIVFCSLLLYAIIPDNSLFGSKIDWVSQHIVFPDYFRKLFYQTKNFFPSFALSIGAGQNIYNFSYYGLLNPLMIFSYLFPFISMKNYIIGLNIVLYILLGVIMYYFFKKKVSKTSALTTTLILLLAAPILFHFHKHFMFVNYLPFLFLALIGVDKFFEDGRLFPICLSLFFVITISYYFAISSILVVCIYALYKYISLNDKIVIKDMIKKALIFLIPVMISILLAGVLLLPTFYVLKTGRASNTISVSFIEKLIPYYNIDSILYNNYSMGLTGISLISLISFYNTKDKDKKVVAVLLSIIFFIPLFVYLLNGNLYLRNKVCIPFISLMGILLCYFINDLLNKKISLKRIVLIVVIVSSLCILFKYKNVAIYFDLIFLLFSVFCYYKKYTNKFMFIILLLFVPFITLYISNSNDLYVSKNEDEKVVSEDISRRINNTLNRENDLVRFNNLDNTLQNVNRVYDINYNQDSIYSSVYNPLYNNFYKKIFKNTLSYRNNLVLSQNNDILFQTFMGVKYIYTTGSVPIGYKKIDKDIYVNENVLPMFYGTDRITNSLEFDKMKYPDNISALLNSVVVKDGVTNEAKDIINEIDLGYNVSDLHDVNILKKDNYIDVKSLKDDGWFYVNLDQGLGNDILIVSIDLLNKSSCKNGDLKISINDITNVQTCKQWIYKNNNKTFHYVISNDKDVKRLKVKFSKGNYKIGNISIYKLNYGDLGNIKSRQSEFVVNKKLSVGDNIYGKINMKNDGYFVTSIPYEKGFSVYVDSKKVKYEVVNKAFLGFKLSSGEHDIKITYKAPLQRMGLIISTIGFIFSIFILIHDFIIRKRHN